jgi:hypothetical protein
MAIYGQSAPLARERHSLFSFHLLEMFPDPGFFSRLDLYHKGIVENIH